MPARSDARGTTIRCIHPRTPWQSCAGCLRPSVWPHFGVTASFSTVGCSRPRPALVRRQTRVTLVVRVARSYAHIDGRCGSAVAAPGTEQARCLVQRYLHGPVSSYGRGWTGWTARWGGASPCGVVRAQVLASETAARQSRPCGPPGQWSPRSLSEDVDHREEIAELSSAGGLVDLSSMALAAGVDHHGPGRNPPERPGPSGHVHCGGVARRVTVGLERGSMFHVKPDDCSAGTGRVIPAHRTTLRGRGIRYVSRLVAWSRWWPDAHTSSVTRRGVSRETKAPPFCGEGRCDDRT